jgi:hypothetical protein
MGKNEAWEGSSGENKARESPREEIESSAGGGKVGRVRGR